METFDLVFRLLIGGALLLFFGATAVVVISARRALKSHEQSFIEARELDDQEARRIRLALRVQDGGQARKRR